MSGLEPFPDYEAAVATCGTGADEDLLARVVAYKTERPRALTDIAPEQVINVVTAVAIAATAKQSAEPLRVLDFGGGCGVHYHRVQPVVGTSFHWVVVETEAIVRHVVGATDGRLASVGTISAAMAELGRVDLVLASGSLQCVSDPIAYLGDLEALQASFIALLRFPVWNGEDRVGVQNSRLSHNGIGPLMPGIEDLPVRTPVTLTSFETISATLAPNYEMIFKTASPSASYEIDGIQAPGASMIYRRIKRV